jgi:THO complex subunit 2
MRCLPYCERHLLYKAWRGRGVDRTAIGLKHFEVARAECEAGHDARQALKRVANEKKNAKHVGRALAKTAHSNPFVVFHIILSQIESYDNMIQPIIESFGFMTPLALDVLSYMLPLHLADTSRHKLQDNGIHISHWFQYLANFTGVFYRVYPQTELRCLIDFLLLRLKAGGSHELLVFNELLARMGGCEVLEDISDAQLGGLAGGEVLRREIFAFEKASKRAISRLQDALCTPDKAAPMLALVAQQRGYALFKGEMDHVKQLGQLFDRCQRVLVQLVEFLARSTERPTNLGTQEKHSYLELLPDLQTLCGAMCVEPQVAFHAARPLMAAAAAARRNAAKNQLDITAKIACGPDGAHLWRWDPDDETMNAAMLAVSPAHDWEAITIQFYLTFWSLSLYDIKVPTKAYDAQITLLRAKYNNTQREVEEPEKRKKEMARYLGTVEALSSELAAQKDHCKQVLSELQSKRDTLLGSVVLTREASSYIRAKQLQN